LGNKVKQDKKKGREDMRYLVLFISIVALLGLPAVAGAEMKEDAETSPEAASAPREGADLETSEASEPGASETETPPPDADVTAPPPDADAPLKEPSQETTSDAPEAPGPAPAAISSVGDTELAPRASVSRGVDLSRYGGRVSLGVAIGGGGVVGMPLRIYPVERLALEMGVYYRPVIVIGGDADPGGPMFAGGIIPYFSKRVSGRRERVKLNGMFLKGGYSLSQMVNSAMVATGWAHERMRLTSKRYAFNMELGAGLLINDLKRAGFEVNKYQFLVYWKFHWSWAFATGFNRRG
jgi:hypothetical protein